MVIETYTLKIDGKEIENINILHISFADAAGVKSDKLTLKVRPDFPKPKPAAKVELIFKRYKNDELITKLDAGLFHVQTVTRTNNKHLSITATGVEFSAKQKEKVSFHYKETKLSNILKVVAKRLDHALKFKTDDLDIKSLNQTNETDLNFLERLAKDYNCLFSIKNDVIYFVNKDNKDLPENIVNVATCSTSTIKHSSKTYYKSCIASWHDKDLAKTITVSVFAGTPVLKIKGAYKTKQEAELKAKAKLLDTNKGIIKGSFSTRGEAIYAGTKVKLIETYKDEDNGVFSVLTCNHTYSDSTGWNVSIEVEN